MRDFARRHLNFAVPASIEGRDYRIPVWGRLEVRGVTSSWKTVFYREVLGLRPGTFIDVGANLGLTLLEMRAVSDHQYVGFEPNPSCSAYLWELVALNRLSDVCLVPCGLSDVWSIRHLYVSPDNASDPGATMIEGLRTNTSSLPSRTVITCRFDEIVSSLPAKPVALVKIDVEGHEWEVLRGMETTLRAERPVLLVEVLPRAGGTSEEDSGMRKAALLGLLDDLAYDLLHVSPRRRENHFELMRTREFQSLPFRREQSYDYAFVPEELTDAIQDIPGSARTGDSE